MKKTILALPYVVWMAIFIIVPLLLVVGYAFTTRTGGFTLDNFSTMLEYTPIFTRSFGLAFTATVICLVIAYPLAYILSQREISHQSLYITLLMLPMWMNFLLRTYAWMSILENKGFINRFLDLIGLPTVTLINTPFAIVLGMVYNYLPFMVLPIYTVMIKIDKRLIEAAQDLGANSATVFRRVLFPLSLPGVLSGITMVFVPGVSTFVISNLLGGGKNMMVGDLIEKQFIGAAYNPYLGSAIALVMMVLIFICMWIVDRFTDDSSQGVIM